MRREYLEKLIITLRDKSDSLMKKLVGNSMKLIGVTKASRSAFGYFVEK